jgi:hypothetical protein
MPLTLSASFPTLPFRPTVSVQFSGPAPRPKSFVGGTYVSNGYTMNSNGYLANPSRSAQIEARNAGALTNSETARMGLSNRR